MREPRAPFGGELFLADICAAKEIVDLIQGVPVYADADREPLGVQIQRPWLDEADNAVRRCVVRNVIICFYRTRIISVCIIEILGSAGDDDFRIMARVANAFYGGDKRQTAYNHCESCQNPATEPSAATLE